MAGKVSSGSFAVLLLDGYNLLPSKLQGHTHKIEALQDKSDGLGDGTAAQSPVGLSKATLTQSGAFFEDSANGAHVALNGSTALRRLLCFAFTGNVIGQRFVGVDGTYVPSYEVLGQVGKLTKANATYEVSGALDRGVILGDHVSKTASWNTKTDGQSVDYAADTAQRVTPIASISVANPTVITTSAPHGLTTGQKIVISGTTSTPTVNGPQTVTVVSTVTFTVPVNVTVGQAGAAGSFVLANTVNGGVGYLSVSAYSGFTNVVVKIRSSADDTTYADLITFTTVVAAPIAERIAVNGTIDRYLCVTGTVTGSGTITQFAGFARN